MKTSEKRDMDSATRLMCVKLEKLYREWIANGRRTRECGDKASSDSSALK